MKSASRPRSASSLPVGPGDFQISSMMGHTGLAFPAYTATKGAILALTRQLASDLSAFVTGTDILVDGGLTSTLVS